MLELEETPVRVLLVDFHLSHSSIRTEEPPVRLLGKVLDKLGTESFGIILDFLFSMLL